MEPTVSLIAPDGSIADVPSSSVAAALAKGAQRAYEMEAPDGTRAFVPESSLPNALSRGAKPLGVIPNIAATPSAVSAPGNGMGVPGLLQGKSIALLPSHTPTIPQQPTEPEYGSDQWYADKFDKLLPDSADVGKFVPQSAVGPLRWIQKNINEPLDTMAQKGAEAGRELGRDVVSGATMMQHAPEYLGATMPSPYGPKPPVESPEQMAQEEHPIALGVASGIGETAGGMIGDPRNWPLLAVGDAQPLLSKLMSGGFGVMMGKDAMDSAQKLYNNWDRMTPDQRAELITKGGLAAIFAGGAATHALSSESGLPWLRKKRFEQAGPEVNTIPEPEPSGQPEIPQPPTAELSTAEPPTAVQPEVQPTQPPTAAPPSLPPGPGAQNAGSVETIGSDIAQLTDWMRGKQISPKPGVGEQLARAGQELKSGASAASDTATNAWNAVAAKTADLWRRYSHPPEWTDFKDALGNYQGDMQAGDLDIQRFANQIKKSVPDALRREAITNWVQAGGNQKVLQERAAASDAKYRPGYEIAAKLSPDEIALANNARNYFDAKLQEAQDVGMLEHGVENYVRQVWAHDPTNQTAQNLLAAAQASALNPDPSFLKNRVFSSYFEGEQAGNAPKTKDIGALLASYDQSFNKAVASRAFIRALHEGKAADGRPLVEVSGSGRVIGDLDQPNEAYFIRPKTKPQNAYDYQVVDHPSLREWKFVSKDENGAPILLSGDMLVHPEYAQKLRNILHTERNPFEQPGLLRGIQRAQSEFKQTMLSFSPFHQVTLGRHAIEHAVNPFFPKEIDLSQPLQRDLVNHGLMIADYHGAQQFSEGLAAGRGLGGKIPVVGKYLKMYEEYLFHSYLPRLKMLMAEHAFARNLKRYSGKLDRDQILELTANQGNAAFGGIAYKMLARNPTAQSVARFVALAPDFLEARARFVAQALKPYGAEQRAALIRGTLYTLAAKAAIGAMLNEKQTWDLDHLFFMRVRGREYALRSVEGDLVHLVSNPRSFIYTRLNPSITQPFIEGVTGRDQFGRPRTGKQQLGDIAKHAVPIPAQGLVDSSERGPADTALQAVGVQSRKYRSPAATLAHKYVIEGGSFPASEKAEAPLMRQYRQGIDKGKFNPDQLRRDFKAGRLTEQDAKNLMTEAKIPQFAREFKRLSLEKALDVWQLADDSERAQIRPLLAAKSKQLENRIPAERAPLEQRLKAALSEKKAPQPAIPDALRKLFLSSQGTPFRTG